MVLRPPLFFSPSLLPVSALSTVRLAVVLVSIMFFSVLLGCNGQPNNECGFLFHVTRPGVIMRLVLCCVITSDEAVDEDPLEETYDQYDDAHNPPSSSPSKLSMLESGGSSLSSSSSSASRSSGSTLGSSLSMAGSSS